LEETALVLLARGLRSVSILAAGLILVGAAGSSDRDRHHAS
jgi:hypothetical protein